METICSYVFATAIAAVVKTVIDLVTVCAVMCVYFNPAVWGAAYKNGMNVRPAVSTPIAVQYLSLIHI